jgi:hypothetical protein
MHRVCSTHGGEDNSNRILVRKPEIKRPVGRPTRKWEENILVKINLRAIR